MIDEASLVALTREFVRTPSVLGTEAVMAERTAEAMRASAFDRVEVDAAGSVVGTVEGSGDGATVLFDAHMDTVDVMPRRDWSRDPFGGELAGGRIWGRGAADMKGALAAMIQAVAALDRRRLRGRVVVAATVEEERLEGAALRLVCERYLPDVVVIGESSNLDLVIAGRGRAELVVSTSGRPAHASTPELGEHAVLRMLEVVRALEALPVMEHWAVGRGVMCLTDIISDPYPAHSVVPSGCRATWERRLVPGETEESVLEAVSRACERAGASGTFVEIARAQIESYTGYAFEEPKWLPPWVLEAADPVASAALAALRSAGLEPGLASYGFCTNAAFSAGIAGIRTIGFGPGREAQAHVVDEYLEVDQLIGACRGYCALAEALTSSGL